MATVYANLGLIYTKIGTANDAKDAFQKALDLNRQLTQELPKEPWRRRPLIFNYLGLGTNQAVLGATDDALHSFDEAKKLIEELGAEANDDLRFRMAQYYANVFKVWVDVGQYEKAMPLGLQGIDIMTKLVNTRPTPESYMMLATLYELSGIANSQINKPEQALSALDAALKLLTALEREPALKNSPNQEEEIQFHQANVYGNRALLFIRTNQLDKALKDFEMARDVSAHLVEKKPEYTLYRRNMAVYLQNIANVYRNRNQFDEALPLLEQARTIREQVVKKRSQNAALSNRAGSMFKINRRCAFGSWPAGRCAEIPGPSKCHLGWIVRNQPRTSLAQVPGFRSLAMFGAVPFEDEGSRSSPYLLSTS